MRKLTKILLLFVLLFVANNAKSESLISTNTQGVICTINVYPGENTTHQPILEYPVLYPTFLCANRTPLVQFQFSRPVVVPYVHITSGPGIHVLGITYARDEKPCTSFTFEANPDWYMMDREGALLTNIQFPEITFSNGSEVSRSSDSGVDDYNWPPTICLKEQDPGIGFMYVMPNPILTSAQKVNDGGNVTFCFSGKTSVDKKSRAHIEYYVGGNLNSTKDVMLGEIIPGEEEISKLYTISFSPRATNLSLQITHLKITLTGIINEYGEVMDDIMVQYFPESTSIPIIPEKFIQYSIHDEISQEQDVSYRSKEISMLSETVDTNHVTVYGVDGTSFSNVKTREQLNNLPKGYYIINGEKLLVR